MVAILSSGAMELSMTFLLRPTGSSTISLRNPYMPDRLSIKSRMLMDLPS